MTMRFIIFLLLLSLSSCMTFEKDFYERISGMQFPKQVRVIETFDNGEFVTTTSLAADSSELKMFIQKYQFEQTDKFTTTLFMGEHRLKKIKPDFNNLKDLYFKTGSKGKNSWCYIIDLKRQVLWAEIQYPDWGGT